MAVNNVSCLKPCHTDSVTLKCPITFHHKLTLNFGATQPHTPLLVDWFKIMLSVWPRQITGKPTNSELIQATTEKHNSEWVLLKGLIETHLCFEPNRVLWLKYFITFFNYHSK